jgi:hypothetical protein
LQQRPGNRKRTIEAITATAAQKQAASEEVAPERAAKSRPAPPAAEQISKPAQPADALSWEALVTDGHVRAERLRRAGPRIIATGVLLLLVGFWLGHTGLRLVPAAVLPDARNALLSADMEAVQAPATHAFDNLPLPQVMRKEANSLAPASQLPQVVAATLASLNKTGSLPDSQIKFSHLTPQAFWTQPWPHTVLAATGADDITLVGAIVNTGTVDAPYIARWLGVFRKVGSTWQYASLTGTGFLIVPGYPSVQAGDIPMTLQAVLPGS